MSSESTQMASSSRGGDQSNILSSKVFRALEVRSDTPAMKAALDALTHLPDHQDDLFTVDSRSVRVAIEQDALQQALLLQDELRSLLQTVTKLGQGVAETAAIAHRVDEVIHSNVVTKSGSGVSGLINGDKQGVGGISGAITSNDDHKDSNALSGNGFSTSGRNSDDSALEEEQRLAFVLNNCFTRRNIARKRVEAVHEFLERFDLSEEDSRLLEHYAFEDVETSNVNGIAFLNALERVLVIRKELGQTVGSLDMLHHQKQSHGLSEIPSFSTSFADDNRLGASSALRMMETLAQKQERAYERLYHWLQKYLHLHSHEQHNPGLEQHDGDRLDEVLAHPFVRRSLRVLQNVPAFYSHLLELIAQSRRSEETRRFLLALTSGHNGLPPIEMRAHDSVVYVGDMLAFCFRAFSVEADVARGLYSLEEESGEEGMRVKDAKKDNNVSTEDDTDFLVEKPLTRTEMLALSMGGISRPLKSRILQVISNLARHPGDDDDVESDDGMDNLDEEGAFIRSNLSQLYDICGLLLFYAAAVNKSMAKLSSSDEGAARGSETLVEAGENPIIDVILHCLGEATNAYEASLRVYASMLEQLQLLTGDSESSLAHIMIVRIVEARKESPGFATDVDCPKMYRQILSLDWPCNILIEAALPACKTLDDTVTLKQSISVARQGNLTASVATSLEQRLSEKEGALIDDLVGKETTEVLDFCGLGRLVVAWDRYKAVQVEGMTMASFPGLTPDEAEIAMKEFFSSLYSPPIPSFENTIKDPTLRKLARNKIAKRVCERYASMYDAMLKPETGGYDDTSFLGHTPEQVNTLFTV